MTRRGEGNAGRGSSVLDWSRASRPWGKHIAMHQRLLTSKKENVRLAGFGVEDVLGHSAYFFPSLEAVQLCGDTVSL